MDLLLIGHGKMNRLVAELAAEQGHRVLKIVDRSEDWTAGWAPGLVAIDFSVPEAVLDNLERCMLAGIPAVVGTTGWYQHLDRASALVEASPVGAVYGANFSVGVQAFYRAVASAAANLPAQYQAFVWEGHHRAKLDAPSGTAKRIVEVLNAGGHPAESVVSTRVGFLPGTHTVGFDGPDDTMTLTHTARSRRGFAAGALLAAGWILGRRGLHEFTEVMEHQA